MMSGLNQVFKNAERLRCEIVSRKSKDTGKKTLMFNRQDKKNCSMRLWATVSVPLYAQSDAYSENKEIQKAARRKWEPCVYFLLKQEKIIYIGSTHCLLARARLHFYRGKRFDEIRVISSNLKNYRKLEARLINKFKPPLNRNYYESIPKTPAADIQ